MGYNIYSILEPTRLIKNNLEIPVSIAVAQTDIVNSEKPLKISSEKTPESPEDRLQKLADVKEKGLIDEDEFKSKKEEILKGM